MKKKETYFDELKRGFTTVEEFDIYCIGYRNVISRLERDSDEDFEIAFKDFLLQQDDIGIKLTSEDTLRYWEFIFQKIDTLMAEIRLKFGIEYYYKENLPHKELMERLFDLREVINKKINRNWIPEGVIKLKKEFTLEKQKGIISILYDGLNSFCINADYNSFERLFISNENEFIKIKWLQSEPLITYLMQELLPYLDNYIHHCKLIELAFLNKKSASFKLEQLHKSNHRGKNSTIRHQETIDEIVRKISSF